MKSIKSTKNRKSRHRVLMLASVASMIDQFNMPNIRLLKEMGYEVHVACNFQEGNTCHAARIEKLKRNLEGMHVLWFQWDCPRGMGRARDWIRACHQLGKLFETMHYDWIHCHSPVGSVLGRVMAHWYQTAAVYTAHGFHFYKGAPLKNWLLYYPVEKLLAYWTEELVTVNEEDDCFARRNLRAKRIRRIPGAGIDTSRFLPRQDLPDAGSAGSRMEFCRAYRLPEDAVVLLSVGELSRRKNHGVVLKALAGLCRKDIFYLICGQGSLHQELVNQADRLGIREQLRLGGFQEKIELFYQNADIFVFPSMQEGLPVALMEAMATGLPCIVSDIRGNRELIPEQNMQFAYHDSARLQEILQNLLQDTQMRRQCGYRNRQKVKAYDTRRVQKQMKRIYKEMQDICG